MEIEQQIIARAEAYFTSTSHDESHRERVAAYGLVLQKIHGGDPDVIRIAALLHDLGRSNKKLMDRDSVEESVRLARPILQEVGLPEEMTDKICDAILDHDQPGLRPKTIEGRILKEADYLDGFGARGILRTLIWVGEKGNESLNDVMKRFREKMPARIASLEFPESREIAMRQYRLVELFLALLEDPSLPECENLTGKYIIFEGTSGTGKETQARKVHEYFTSRGIDSVLVFEPTPDAKKVFKEWRNGVDSNLMDLYLFLADRVRIMNKEVMPALRAGKVVVSVRSWLSTPVYQAQTKQEEAMIKLLHNFVPTPDLIFWLDLDPEIAIERIEKRGEELGKFEKIERLRKHRNRYEEILKGFNNVHKIDGGKSIDAVFQDVSDVLREANIDNKDD